MILSSERNKSRAQSPCIFLKSFTTEAPGGKTRVTSSWPSPSEVSPSATLLEIVSRSIVMGGTTLLGIAAIVFALLDFAFSSIVGSNLEPPFAITTAIRFFLFNLVATDSKMISLLEPLFVLLIFFFLTATSFKDNFGTSESFTILFPTSDTAKR